MTTKPLSMAEYVAEVRYASSILIPALWHEQTALDALSREHADLSEGVAAEYEAANFIALNAEDADDVMLATSRHWDNYFGPDRDLHDLQDRIAGIKAQMHVRSFSLATLSGALLQIAKQGLSISHSAKPSPRGRQIGTQHLSTVIWEARNQAIHWEEAKPSKNVVACFDALKVEASPKFGDSLCVRLR